MIFDDSIEHEAWNDSDAPRAILLFEIWRPELTVPERAALTAMYESVTAYDEE
jgi:aspartyl/asparaginyl beta-hydroxylase (cupin superfamily)